MSNSPELWMPIALTRFEKLSKFPAGSLVFVPSTISERKVPFPAIRFDVKDEHGEIFPWLFWLQGSAVGPDYLPATAISISDSLLHSDSVVGIVPSPSLRVDLEFAAHAELISGDESTWTMANGALAFGTFGIRVAAVGVGNHSQRSIPIDTSTWTSDQRQTRNRVSGWLRDWRLRIWDGAKADFFVVPFSLN